MSMSCFLPLFLCQNLTLPSVTKWLDHHPGGADTILAVCGQDGSATFKGKSDHKKTAAAYQQQYSEYITVIGELGSTIGGSSASGSITAGSKASGAASATASPKLIISTLANGTVYTASSLAPSSARPMSLSGLVGLTGFLLLSQGGTVRAGHIMSALLIGALSLVF